MEKLKGYNIDLNYKYANIVNKRSIRFLSLQPHLVSIKTAGSNYFLFLTRINEKNTCLFIDRKIKQEKWHIIVFDKEKMQTIACAYS